MSHRDPRIAQTDASGVGAPSASSGNARSPADAARYYPSIPMQVTAGVAAMRAQPADDGEMVNQALYGDEVEVFDEREDGWAWVRLRTDGYAGYIAMEALSAPVLPATHQVTALRTYVFSEPNLKSAPRFLISRTAQLAVEGAVHNGFLPLARSGFVFADHLADLDSVATDWVGVAESFLGAPYLWGGRESLGCDCSGLIQTALRAGGIKAPRDTGMQEPALGVALDRATTPLQRGDLVFWKGHVGVMTDPVHLLHANAHHMCVARESLAAAERRIAERYGPITSVRRLA